MRSSTGCNWRTMYEVGLPLIHERWAIGTYCMKCCTVATRSASQLHGGCLTCRRALGAEGAAAFMSSR